jgi:hypothetical protein
VSYSRKISAVTHSIVVIYVDVDDYLGDPRVLSHRLTGNRYWDFLLQDLPKLLEDVTLAVRVQVLYMHDSAPAHFSRAVRDVLNNTYHDGWIGRGGLTAWPPLHQIWILWIITAGTQKFLCVCSSCWQRRGISSHCGCLSDYPHLPRHSSTDAQDDQCRGLHGLSWKTFWTIIIKVIFSYNTQIKCLLTNVDMDIVFLFSYMELLHKVCHHLPATPCITNAMLCGLIGWQRRRC